MSDYQRFRRRQRKLSGWSRGLRLADRVFIATIKSCLKYVRQH